MRIQQILQETAHRPWPLPATRPVWYQEWNRLLFLHFRVETALIKKLLPAGLQPDVFDNSAWVSLVPFTMNRIRPILLPSWRAVSDFDEVNLRTYVTDGTKSGIYFFSLEAARFLPALLAGSISGMPYEQAQIRRSQTAATALYEIHNARKNSFASIRYTPGAAIKKKTALHLWLTERYCVYLDQHKRLYRYQVHHIPWPLQEPDLQDIQLNYPVGPQILTEQDIVSAQYSPGIQVLAWKRELL